jgi:DNA-binding NarL/FixJ family response regulator
MEQSKIKLLIVDDHRIMREGLISLLRNEPEMEIIGEAENGREAVLFARKLRPDVVIMDISMPDMNGMDAARRITSTSESVRIIALSMYADRRFVIGMTQAGATGYLLKDCAFEELLRAIRAVAGGQAYFCPEVANVMVEELLEKGRRCEDRSRNLSSREREILQLIAEGMSTKEIARHLNMSVKTAESHRRQIMEKTGIRTIAALTKYAIKEGLTSVEG